MKTRTMPCGPGEARGRLRKAERFLDAARLVAEFAEELDDSGDIVVTLSVHAGIAAADAICCASLGEHARGDAHRDALAVIRRVRSGGSAFELALETLLSLKARAGYSHLPVPAGSEKRALRRATQLVDAAIRLVPAR